MEKNFNMIPFKYIKLLLFYDKHFILCIMYKSYSFFRDVQGTIIMFDLTNKQSLLNALSDKENKRKNHSSWIKEVNFKAEDEKFPVKVLG